MGIFNYTVAYLLLINITYYNYYGLLMAVDYIWTIVYGIIQKHNGTII